MHAVVRPASVTWVEGPGYRVYSAPCDLSSYWHRLELDLPPADGDPSPWLAVWREHNGAKAVGTAWFAWETLLNDAAPRPTLEGASRHTVFVTSELPLRPEVPEGLTLRPVQGDQEWEAAIHLSAAPHGGDADAVSWARWYLDSARHHIERGHGTWWGAFDGSTLVGSLALLHRGEDARFQEVGTLSTHRGRGVCTALVSHAVRTLLDRHPGTRVCIVAEQGSQPERIYRRLGFEAVSVLDAVGVPCG